MSCCRFSDGLSVGSWIVGLAAYFPSGYLLYQKVKERFPDAIRSVLPEADVQLCIVHQIRNSVKYVGSKNQKLVLLDLKLVYAAQTKELAETELDNLEAKWGEQYPIVIKSCRDKWDNLSRISSTPSPSAASSTRPTSSRDITGRCAKSPSQRVCFSMMTPSTNSYI